MSVTNSQSPTPNPQQEAEAGFHKVIEIAQQQQAKSLELPAVMSLSRLWQQQCKKVKAQRMLAEIYNWFTEGFDTKDLQEAKALLGNYKSSYKKGAGEHMITKHQERTLSFLTQPEKPKVSFLLDGIELVMIGGDQRKVQAFRES